MSEVPDADRQEQDQPAVPDAEPDDVVEVITGAEIEPEAPVADAIEQRLPVPGAEDEYEVP